MDIFRVFASFICALSAAVLLLLLCTAYAIRYLPGSGYKALPLWHGCMSSTPVYNESSEHKLTKQDRLVFDLLSY